MAKEKKKSKYGSLRNGAVAAGAKQLEKKDRGGAIQSGDKSWWKPKKGNNVIDIIPYEVTIKNHPMGIKAGELYQQIAYKMHYNVGSDDKTIACPTSIGKPCPICSRRAELYKDPSATEEEINELKAKEKVCFNIIDVNDEDKGVQLFDMSPYLFANTLYEEIEAADGDFDSVFDLDAGLSLKIRFSEKKIGKTTFLEASRIDFEEREAYDDSIVDETLDLDKALTILDYKVIEAMFLDIDPDIPEVDEEKEEPPARTRRGAKKPEPEEEEAPEEEEEAPEEEEEEVKPPARSRKSKVKEEEPEEEEEVKKPTRTRGKKEPKPEPEEEDNGDDNECPHGMNFGTDCETDDACDTCDVWEECKDKLEEIQAASKPNRKRK